ncbi:hypothetical protein HMPREF1870_02402 [Bacteroidales bacterium KA00344]|nr:hypothetical protein HMPREF1870_02402 [Bacteroidales bacterium KA00344]
MQELYQQQNCAKLTQQNDYLAKTQYKFNGVPATLSSIIVD